MRCRSNASTLRSPVTPHKQQRKRKKEDRIEKKERHIKDAAAPGEPALRLVSRAFYGFPLPSPTRMHRPPAPRRSRPAGRPAPVRTVERHHEPVAIHEQPRSPALAGGAAGRAAAKQHLDRAGGPAAASKRRRARLPPARRGDTACNGYNGYNGYE